MSSSMGTIQAAYFSKFWLKIETSGQWTVALIVCSDGITKPKCAERMVNVTISSSSEKPAEFLKILKILWQADPGATGFWNGDIHVNPPHPCWCLRYQKEGIMEALRCRDTWTVFVGWFLYSYRDFPRSCSSALEPSSDFAHLSRTTGAHNPLRQRRSRAPRQFRLFPTGIPPVVHLR